MGVSLATIIEVMGWNYARAYKTVTEPFPLPAVKLPAGSKGGGRTMLFELASVYARLKAAGLTPNQLALIVNFTRN